MKRQSYNVAVKDWTGYSVLVRNIKAIGIRTAAIKAVEEYVEEDMKSVERLDKAAIKQSDTLRLYDKIIAEN